MQFELHLPEHHFFRNAAVKGAEPALGAPDFSAALCVAHLKPVT